MTVPTWMKQDELDVLPEPEEVEVVINGYTWPGIEYGEPPSCAYTFFEYIDALRLGQVERFKQEIEPACKLWYFPTLDRGAGAALHMAADHGQLAVARFLVEQRGVEVNQRDSGRGWTPLMRCARMAHYKNAPYLQARPLGCWLAGWLAGGVFACWERRYLWEPGAVRAELARLVERYAAVPKKPAYRYEGPSFGDGGRRLMAAWNSLPKLYPPKNWRPPPPAGYEDAQGARLAAVEPWRPAGDNDGSLFMRPMTEEELRWQAENC
ncbi:hypothetical protein CHLNCDRAFT_141012 [Chlorella variabilis]|uniref:Uncharacterized protein n=1 Tax=Chlorella variabilis TaxID=554065 RepID=E1ZRZ3_CHLVA|nr:hypothetical protein CHLNCDRAFT_141012 [Chlorella variabilis]EFN51391.1 hypothetical protein CHLNCDRAFT_141012 [Chlorella variabilis]|eukprot:XP_005843493.1 hypothetical protein CHLNCDRAFT_141012 [Chlorella variabilis]